MKRVTGFLLLALAVAGCEGGPGGTPGSGSEPSVGLGSFTLTASDKALVTAANGRPMTELLSALGTIVGERGGRVKKNKLIAALDQAFEVRCHEICEIKER